MPEQQSLLDWTGNVDRDYKAPGTSSRAASAASKYAGKTFQAILKALSERPMTPDEVAEVTGINLLTARPRMSDLASPRELRATGWPRSSRKPASNARRHQAVRRT